MPKLEYSSQKDRNPNISKITLKIWKQIAEDDSPGKTLSPCTSNNRMSNYIRLEKNKLWDIKVSQFDICVENEKKQMQFTAFQGSYTHYVMYYNIYLIKWVCYVHP